MPPAAIERRTMLLVGTSLPSTALLTVVIPTPS